MAQATRQITRKKGSCGELRRISGKQLMVSRDDCRARDGSQACWRNPRRLKYASACHAIDSRGNRAGQRSKTQSFEENSLCRGSGKEGSFGAWFWTISVIFLEEAHEAWGES